MHKLDLTSLPHVLISTFVKQLYGFLQYTQNIMLFIQHPIAVLS